MPIVEIEITKKLPDTAVVESTYRIKGSVKLLGAVGAPPFVYAKIKRKEWFKPEDVEDVDYDRGWPVPLTGDFSVDFKPEKEGDYEVSVVATPALVPLPLLGVMPTIAESDSMKVTVGQKPPAAFRFSEVTIDGNSVGLSNHDADSRLLLQKNTTDYLDVMAAFEWIGPGKTATISVKAGHKGVAGFMAKSGAYTQTIELPESPDTPYIGNTREAIRIPLTNAEDIKDGAVEIVAKIPGAPDYITHIWNVYRTKAPVVAFRFSDITIDGNNIALGNHDADSGLFLEKSTSDYLDIVPAFEWQGPEINATISIKAGHHRFGDIFVPKTGAYTRTIKLPEAIGTTYSAEISSPIRVPLISAGDLDDGAIEVVLKISGEPDYISQIWNVFITKEPGAEQPQTLEVDITPAGSGYVTTDPQPEVGPAQWFNGSTGKFAYGTRVKVTAYPYSNYVFDHWSDEIEGGVSYANPAYVAGAMTEHRAVKAHFRLPGEPPPGEPPPGAPPAADIRNFNFMPTSGTYKIGDNVPFSAVYEYRGKKQAGQLVLSIGTGLYPTFITRQTYLPMNVAFDEAMDWVRDEFSGSFVLTAALEPGQKYNVRGKLETLVDRTQETDTDWGIITIASLPPEAPGTGNFTMNIDGSAAGARWNGANRWAVYYLDPVTNVYVGSGDWHYLFSSVKFTQVHPGGNIAVFLKNSMGGVSPQLNSGTLNFSTTQDKTYEFIPDASGFSGRIIEL